MGNLDGPGVHHEAIGKDMKVRLLPGDDNLGPAHPPEPGPELMGVVDLTDHPDPFDIVRLQGLSRTTL